MTEIEDMFAEDIINYVIDYKSIEHVTAIRETDIEPDLGINILIGTHHNAYYIEHGSDLYEYIYNKLVEYAMINKHREMKLKEEKEFAEYQRLKLKYENVKN